MFGAKLSMLLESGITRILCDKNYKYRFPFLQVIENEVADFVLRHYVYQKLRLIKCTQRKKNFYSKYMTSSNNKQTCYKCRTTNYSCIQMSAFVEEFLKHFDSDGNWRTLRVYCTEKKHSSDARTKFKQHKVNCKLTEINNNHTILHVTITKR